MSKNRFTGITARVFMTGAAALLLFSYLSVFINPARAWFMTVSGLLFVPLAVVNLFLLLWAIKRRSKAGLIPLVALLPALFFTGRYISFSSSEGVVEEDSFPVKILTYNVGRFGSSYGNMDRMQCADSIITFLKSCDADIICLQEVLFGKGSGIRKYISDRFSGYHCEYYLYHGKSGYYGNVTLSRYPSLKKGKITFENSANMALYTDYNIKGTRFRIYNCHLESYGLSLPRVVKSLANRDTAFFRKTEEKVRMSISRRASQVDKVLRDIEACPLDAFVCGDFNDNPMSYTYWKMSRGRKDSFVEAGNGFGATYSFLWPMLRIDYLLFPDSFKAVGHRTYRIGYSDHYPVAADICII